MQPTLVRRLGRTRLVLENDDSTQQQSGNSSSFGHDCRGRPARILGVGSNRAGLAKRRQSTQKDSLRVDRGVTATMATTTGLIGTVPGATAPTPMVHFLAKRSGNNNGRRYHHYQNGNSGYEWSGSDQRSSYYVHHYRGTRNIDVTTRNGGNQFWHQPQLPAFKFWL